MTLTIRPLETGDKPAWTPLWRAYLDFYETAFPDAVYDETFARLTSPSHPDQNGLVLRNDRLLCDTGAALRHLTHAGERRGTDRKNGGLLDRSEVGSPLPFA